MWAWFSRLFRSRAEVLAEKAEVDGKFDEAARLYVECGARGEAFRVLMRAAESAKHLSDRRDYLTRAYAIARSDELRAQARRALGAVTLAEAEASPPRNDEERARLVEAAADLEAGGAYREAARAYRLLGDREGVERVLVLAGDVEGYEREAGADEAQERHRLRRRNAMESFNVLWRSGDRRAALATLDEWLRAHEDAEVRALRDERAATLLDRGRFEARIAGESYVFVGALPVSLGREGDVVLRGAGVSREHCVIERGEDGALVLRDKGSRNGTLVQGVPLAGRVPLAAGQTFSLGSDLVLRVESADESSAVLVVERGMDRGRRVVLVPRFYRTPLGTLRFEGRCALLEPALPVHLGGQRVAATITLARGDRVESQGTLFEVVG